MSHSLNQSTHVLFKLFSNANKSFKCLLVLKYRFIQHRTYILGKDVLNVVDGNAEPGTLKTDYSYLQRLDQYHLKVLN